ncbi:hypothetical protein [Timonella senegalensis]|uniref:hypothetical protein n=1 Tax=Timonella senegalensis TaxID=1465825 RepID=UPI002FDD9E58
MTTPREQLAKIAYSADNQDLPADIMEGEWKTGSPEIVDYAYAIADAIIAAGWTPPIPETHNPATEN